MKTWNTRNGYLVSRILSVRSNVFLVSGAGKTFLVDTGPGRVWGKLKRRLDNLNIRKIDFLILTHTHFDHASNSAKIKRELGAKVIVHREEASYLERGSNIIPHGTNLLIHFLIKNLGLALSVRLNYEHCEPDILVDEFLDFKIPGFNIYIIHTPGHTAGSLSVIVDDEIALVGDTMFGIIPGAIFPPFANNTDDLIRSWGKILQTKCTLFLPSHGYSNSAKLVRREYQKRSTQVLG